MILFLTSLENNIVALFCISVILLTVWEYIVGVLLEKIFNTKYWDYSNHKFNFQGRICLTNSIYWGILGVIFVKYIHPFMEQTLEKINPIILNCTISIIFIIFIIDMITSIITIKNIKATLERAENINKEIKEKLKEIRKLRKEKEEKIPTSESVQQVIETLKKKRNRIILRLYKNVYRLKKAFPAINTSEITQILNEKIEFRKKKIKNKQKNSK